jgi:hypothetical protein
MNKKEDNKDKNKDSIIKKYTELVSLFDYYITKNIVQLVKSNKDFDFIKEHIFLLAIMNKIGKNSLNILLDNSLYDIISLLIKEDVGILSYSNINERNLLNSLLFHEKMYVNIIDFLLKESDETNLDFKKFKIKLITVIDIYGKNFIDNCIEIIKINQNIDVNITDEKTNMFKIIQMLKLIYELDKEDELLIINGLCRELQNEKLLLNILKYINPNHLDTYPDLDNNTFIDYLILR